MSRTQGKSGLGSVRNASFLRGPTLGSLALMDWACEVKRAEYTVVLLMTFA